MNLNAINTTQNVAAMQTRSGVSENQALQQQSKQIDRLQEGRRSEEARTLGQAQQARVAARDAAKPAENEAKAPTPTPQVNARGQLVGQRINTTA